MFSYRKTFYIRYVATFVVLCERATEHGKERKGERRGITINYCYLDCTCTPFILVRVLLSGEFFDLKH